jgi:serine/threonine protein kinase
MCTWNAISSRGRLTGSFVHIYFYCCRYQRGLIHGSLKPTNILVADNRQVCIADYGMIEIEPSGNVCSHQYFSPEAWKGVRLSIRSFSIGRLKFMTPLQVISKPSDVFAFAMSSYEVRLFLFNNIQLIQTILDIHVGAPLGGAFQQSYIPACCS